MADEDWSPPPLERVKLRLMMLWANAYRSYLEVEVGAAPEDVGPLCKWVEDCLA